MGDQLDLATEGVPVCGRAFAAIDRFHDDGRTRSGAALLAGLVAFASARALVRPILRLAEKAARIGRPVAQVHALLLW